MRRPKSIAIPTPGRLPHLLLLLFPVSFFLLPSLPGCLPHVDQRVQEFTDDGVYLFERGDYEHARETFEYAMKLQGEDANLLFDIGQCYDRQGKAAKAEDAYNACLAKTGNHAACRHALALLMVRGGRRGDAEKMIQGWLADQPKLADAYAEEGWRLRQDGNLPQAQARLQQALTLDPQNVRANVEMGIYYEHVEMPDRALALYRRALARDPKQPELVERITVLTSRGVGKPRPD